MRRLRSYKDADLYEVAKAYYLSKLTQEEIAGKIGRTRQDIGYMLQAAQERNLVAITINEPATLKIGAASATHLKRAFPQLKDVLVAEAPDPRLGAARKGWGAAIRPHLDLTATAVFERMIDTPTAWPIAVGAGALVRLVLERLVGRCIESKHYPTTVPLVGWYANEFTVNALQNADYVMSELRKAKDADGMDDRARHIVPLVAPARINQTELSTIEQIPLIHDAIAALAKIRHVFAVVEPYTAGHRRQSVVSRDLEEQATCSVSGLLLTSSGDPLPESAQPFGMKLARLKEIAMSKTGTVLLSGRKTKPDDLVARAAFAALQGGYCNLLVVDQYLAEDLIKLL